LVGGTGIEPVTSAL